jgi:hypothetical protein
MLMLVLVPQASSQVARQEDVRIFVLFWLNLRLALNSNVVEPASCSQQRCG